MNGRNRMELNEAEIKIVLGSCGDRIISVGRIDRMRKGVEKEREFEAFEFLKISSFFGETRRDGTRDRIE